MGENAWQIPSKGLRQTLRNLPYLSTQRHPNSLKTWQKGAPGVLIGFNPSLLSYKVLSQSGRIVDTKHVIFNHQKPSTILIEEDQNTPVESLPPIVKPQETVQNSTTKDDTMVTIKEEVDDGSESTSESDSGVENNLRPNLRNWDTISKPQRYGFFSEKIPNSLEEALRLPGWKESAKKEF